MYSWKDYLGAALCFRFVCGRSRYMHDFPKRAHRWHRLTACGVHFALAVVHATHALLLTVVIVAFMMSHKEPGRKRSDRLALGRLLAVGPENPDHPVGSVCNPPKYI